MMFIIFLSYARCRCECWIYTECWVYTEGRVYTKCRVYTECRVYMLVQGLYCEYRVLAEVFAVTVITLQQQKTENKPVNKWDHFRY